MEQDNQEAITLENDTSEDTSCFPQKLSTIAWVNSLFGDSENKEHSVHLAATSPTEVSSPSPYASCNFQKAGICLKMLAKESLLPVEPFWRTETVAKVGTTMCVRFHALFGVLTCNRHRCFVWVQ